MKHILEFLKIKQVNQINEEFETQVNNILNKASFEAGKIGRQSLDKNNRFVIMVNAGSKGNDLKYFTNDFLFRSTKC